MVSFTAVSFIITGKLLTFPFQQLFFWSINVDSFFFFFLMRFFLKWTYFTLICNPKRISTASKKGTNYLDNLKGLKTQKKKKTQSIKYIPTFAIHFVIKILSNEKTTFFCPTHIELGNKVIISFCKMHRGPQHTG